MTVSGRARPLALVACAAIAAAAASVSAQPFRPERPLVHVVGTPPGARVDRVDPQRTGSSRTPLPVAELRVAWRSTVKAALEHAPVLDARGVAYVVGARGEVAAIDGDGAERWSVSTGAAGAGPAALLSDDTIAFVDGAGDALGVRDGRVRWKAHVGAADPSRPAAPLALDDGGLVAAAGPDLVLLDSAGEERARARLDEAIVAPLVATKDRVLAVVASGAVWSWAPGALDAARVGTFGSPVEGGAALADDDTLVAVTHLGARLTDLRLREGRARTRAAPGGSIWLGPPAVARGVVFALALTATGERVMAVDPSGQEVGSALLQPGGVAADGGALVLPTAQPTPILVDSSATVLFVTMNGAVGAARRVSQPDPAVELLATVCTNSSSFAPASGIAPAGPGAVVVACRHGEVVAIRSSGGNATPRSRESGAGR
jgi:outer membrane protein assembly factor BamB